MIGIYAANTLRQQLRVTPRYSWLNALLLMYYILRVPPGANILIFLVFRKKRDKKRKND